MVSIIKNWVEGYDTALGIISQYGLMAAIILGVLIVLGNGYEVVARYVFSNPSGIMDELLIYADIGLIWLPLGWIWRRKGHVSVDVLIDKLHGRWSHLLSLFIVFIAFITVVGLTLSVFLYEVHLIEAGRRPETALATPWAIPHILALLGIIIFSLEVLLSLVRAVRLKSKEEASLPDSGADE